MTIFTPCRSGMWIWARCGTLTIPSPRPGVTLRISAGVVSSHPHGVGRGLTDRAIRRNAGRGRGPNITAKLPPASRIPCLGVLLGDDPADRLHQLHAVGLIAYGKHPRS